MSEKGEKERGRETERYREEGGKNIEGEEAEESRVVMSEAVELLSSRHYLKHPHITIIMAFNQM